MRRPFAKLMELVRDVQNGETVGEMAGRLHEDVWRITDAIDANRVVDGERGYI